jgi:CheY-like chemotaxis protein/predicted regulator of Ras-like GTPase activity (Roadblock/LC7/MglB family)
LSKVEADMPPKILIVDRNEAFATMLEQMIETGGDYKVHRASSGSDALVLLHQIDFELAIVDMDLDPGDLGYRDLILGARKLKPAMRFMVIPLMGQALPPEAQQLDIQGTLSKPFFADDLLPSIQQSLSKQAKPPTEPLQTVPEMVQPASSATPQLRAELSQLAREVNADIVLLLSTEGESAQVITHVSTLDSSQLRTFSDLVASTVHAAQETAQFLGRPHRPFEHNMFEDQEMRLYVLTIPEDLIIAVTTPTSTPLGTIRHNMRRAVRTLRHLA